MTFHDFLLAQRDRTDAAGSITREYGYAIATGAHNPADTPGDLWAIVRTFDPSGIGLTAVHELNLEWRKS